MGAPADSEGKKPGTTKTQEKLTLAFGRILVLSLHLVFMATTMARRWNY
jgi:hypothetical protein